MKILVKGGVWKNTEDEILKVAVMKYGKNQWARISSLLVRKTPKQCKARWYEWLDPSIRKTEWSQEEEEKLLHLAKLMPTQWRTIAPMIGRTPAQCLEHYEHLLDQAANGGEDSVEAKKLKPGEVDPQPETRPARPDPIDMDEDEKEMLSEARARLANTMGKKAKRKAREKQLEEARRMASLQKRRELRAAGIRIEDTGLRGGVGNRHNKRANVDFNAEVVFEKKAPAGFFDTTEEKEREQDTSYRALVFPPAQPYEKPTSAIERQKQKDLNPASLDPKLLAQLKAKQEAEQLARRARLVLPAPQVNDEELSQLVKIGSSSASDTGLLGESLPLIAATPSAATATPSVNQPKARERLQQGIQDILALQHTATPLLGGENTPMPRFSGTTSTALVQQTPNTVLMTPNTNQLSKSSERELRMRLLNDLAALPAPKNDYEIVLPESMESDQSESDDDEPMDAAERDQKELARAVQLEQKRLAQRPQCIQRKLPRPPRLHATCLISKDKNAHPAALLVAEEHLAMLRHDSRQFPHPLVELDTQMNTNFTPYDAMDEELLERAKQLVHDELNGEKISVDAVAETEKYVNENYISLYDKAKIVPHRSVPMKDHLQSLKYQFQQCRQHLKELYDSSQSIQERLERIHGGYLKRAPSLMSQISKTFTCYSQIQLQRDALQTAWETVEENALLERLNLSDQWTDQLKSSLSQWQQRFALERYSRG